MTNSAMHKKRLFFWILFPAVVLALGGVVMGLWNAILPQALAAKPLTYWQALGLLLLCRILFGGLHLRPWAGRKPPHLADRWASMSDEERQQLKQRWADRCAKRGEQ